VFIQLFRSSDGETSEPLDFTYKPNSQNRAKRKRYEMPNIPTAVEDFEPTNRGFTQANVTSFGSAYGSQFFSCGSNSSGHNNQQQEESEAELNVLLRIVTSELCSDKLAESELIKYCLDLGNETELMIDAAQPGQVDPRDLNLSVLDKLKLIVKMFKDSYDEEKIRDMMMAIIKSAEERDENVLMDVIQYGSMGDIKELILILVKYKLHDVMQSTNDIDQNALHVSILLGYTSLLKVLIKCGVDVNAVDAFGMTPLHLAVKGDSETTIKELLLSDKINFNVLDDNGNSPLHLSVMNNNLSITKLLIDAGVNVKIQNPTSGFTCLHTAINNHTINRELINYLIEADQALLTIEANNGATTLGMAHANKLPKDIFDHLSSFYDAVDDDEEEEVFDEQCLNELSEIFDSDDKWRVWVIRMDLTKHASEWSAASSPARVVLQHLLVSSFASMFIN
jgi:hypothetical protein